MTQSEMKSKMIETNKTTIISIFTIFKTANTKPCSKGNKMNKERCQQVNIMIMMFKSKKGLIILKYVVVIILINNDDTIL